MHTFTNEVNAISVFYLSLFSIMVNSKRKEFATIAGNLYLTLLHSEWPKFHRVLAILSAIGLKTR